MDFSKALEILAAIDAKTIKSSSSDAEEVGNSDKTQNRSDESSSLLDSRTGYANRNV